MNALRQTFIKRHSGMQQLITLSLARQRPPELPICVFGELRSVAIPRSAWDLREARLLICPPKFKRHVADCHYPFDIQWIRRRGPICACRVPSKSTRSVNTAPSGEDRRIRLAAWFRCVSTFFRGVGKALPIASRTIRRCTFSFFATSLPGGIETECSRGRSVDCHAMLRACCRDSSGSPPAARACSSQASFRLR